MEYATDDRNVSKYWILEKISNQTTGTVLSPDNDTEYYNDPDNDTGYRIQMNDNFYYNTYNGESYQDKKEKTNIRLKEKIIRFLKKIFKR